MIRGDVFVEEDLSAFVKDVVGEAPLRIEADLGNGFVRLNSSEAQRRQAVHDIRSTEDIVIELLRNARDAHARAIFLAVTRDNRRRRLVMIDDGDGVPPPLHELIFEPRVTSKLDTMVMDKWGVHGRGMALYSVSVNAERACVMASGVGLGTSMLVETDLDKLGEKADQSTFPEFELTEAGSVAVRGPRNILRTACEFAVDSAQACTLYLGSATDIVATLYAFGRSSLSVSARAFCRDTEELPVATRLSIAPDAASLSEEALKLGLDLSERSARRILDGHIAPLSPLTDRIRIKGIGDKPQEGDGATPRKRPLPDDQRGLEVAAEDRDRFASQVLAAFTELAEAYYLEAPSTIEVKVGKDAVRVVIPYTRIS